MQILHRRAELNRVLGNPRRKGRSIGFVPTMGYLHDGHLSLVRHAKKENDIVVASIFVNPLQFGPKEDFWRYPRNLVRDTQLLKTAQVDVLFTPVLKEFYLPDFQTSVSIKGLSQPLCGVSRPTHFAGVTTVVSKLLNLVQPTRLYLGQKDYQQYRVIAQMIKDLDMPVEVKLVPIVREADGLAMSSRNVLLSTLERREAAFIHRALKKGEELIRSGQSDTGKIKKAVKEVLKFAPHGRLDYLEIVDAATLVPVVKLKNGSKVLMAMAYYFSKTRLIDNILVTP